jgi:hypothetical protein
MSVSALVEEILANDRAWPLVRDVVPSYVFTTKSSAEQNEVVDGATALSQLGRLRFGNKVCTRARVIARAVIEKIYKTKILVKRCIGATDTRILNEYTGYSITLFIEY